MFMGYRQGGEHIFNRSGKYRANWRRPVVRRVRSVERPTATIEADLAPQCCAEIALETKGIDSIRGPLARGVGLPQTQRNSDGRPKVRASRARAKQAAEP